MATLQRALSTIRELLEEELDDVGGLQSPPQQWCPRETTSTTYSYDTICYAPPPPGVPGCTVVPKDVTVTVSTEIVRC